MHYIIVELESKKGKELELKNKLLNIKKLSLQEESCIDYRVHEDLSNSSSFVLYEVWSSQEDHAKQFQKSYIIDFGNQLEDLLIKPYKCIIAKNLL